MAKANNNLSGKFNVAAKNAAAKAAKNAVKGESSIDASSLPKQSQTDFSGIQIPSPDADPYADLSGLAVEQPKVESPNELQPEQSEPASTAPTEPVAAAPAPQPSAPKPEAAKPQQRARDRADEADEAEARKAELQVAMAQAPAISTVQFSGRIERDRYRAKSEIRKREDSQHTTARKSRGSGVNGKAGGDSYLLFDEASVGTELIIACLRHPNNKLVPLLKSLQGWEDCDFSYATTDPERWVDDNFDRWNYFPFEADVDKQPVPESPSMHIRTIRLHDGSGVRIHPVMAKMYTADFDGDDISVRFSYNINGMHRPVSFLVGTAGDVKIDADFFPLPYWGDERVVETILESAVEFGHLNRVGLKKIAKAYVELSQSKKADEDISKFFQILVAEVKRTSQKDVNHRTLLLLKMIYDTNIDVMRWQTFTAVDSQNYSAQLERIRGEVKAVLPEDFVEVDQSGPEFSAQNLGAAQAAALGLIGDRGEGKSAPFRGDANTGKSTRNNPHTVWKGSKWGFTQTTGPSPEWEEQQRLEYSWRESGEEKLALAAAARYSYDEHAYTQSVEMRRMVLSRMASWGYGGTLPAYLKGAGKYATDLTDYFKVFIIEYNRAAEILNGGRGAWNLDGSEHKIDKSKTPYPPVNLETATMTDMATAYYKVCGDYGFEYLWGDFARNSEVQKMLQHSSWHGFDARFFTTSYADFCELNTMNLDVKFLSGEKNTLEPSEYTNIVGGGFKRNGKPIDSRVGKISWSDPKRDQMFRLFVSSAAIKTKFGHRFTEDFDRAFIDLVAKSKQVAKKGDIREQLPVLFLSLNPDMFLAFGMGSKGAFDANSLSPLSKIAQTLEDKTLKDSEKVDKVKSIYLTLVAQYQTRRLATAKANAEKTVETNPTPEKLFACDDSWRKGLSDLASISQTWSVIAQDLNQGGYLLRSLRSVANVEKDINYDFNDRSPVPISKVFSKKLLAANEYNSLLDLLLDEEISYDLKIQTINLAQRIFGKDVNQPSDSVLPELLRNPTGVHAGNQQLIRRDNAEMRKNLNAFNEAVEGWYCPSERGGMDTLMLFSPGDPEKGYPTPEVARANVWSFINFLRDVSGGVRHLISIPKTAYAMAAAQMWFSTPSLISKKNTQQDALYFLYRCNAYSVNGGMYSDQNMATNWAQGACDVNDFINNPMFMVKLLTDPDYSIDVGLGEYGCTVTMQTLLGEGIAPDSAGYVDAVQSFLVANPNVAASLMPRTVKPGDKADGHTERLDFSTLLYEAPETKVIRANRDRIAGNPDFLALLMLTVKGSGRSYGNLLNEFEQNVDSLIAFCAGIVRDGRAEELRERLTEQIEKAYGYDKSAGSIYDQAISGNGILDKIIKSIERVGESAELFPPEFEVDSIELHLDDEPTLSMYQSMMARATSMQTAHLTSVNGAESEKNAALAFCAAANPEEDCGAAPPEEVDLKVVEDSIKKNDGVYEGRRLYVQREDGSIDSSVVCTYEMLDDIRSIAKQNGGKVRVESPLGCVSDNPCGCHRHSIWDPSTDKRPWHQSTSLGRFMTVFRTFATETYNLQAKKKIAALTPGTVEELREGSGTARIVKRNLWKDDWFQTKDFKVDMQAAWDKANNLDDVKICLAKRFQLAASAIGYEQLTYNDWLTIANVLVKPKTEGEDIVGYEVLTITRLAEIGRNALFDYLAVAPKDHSFSDSANAIMDALSAYYPKSDEENLKWFNDAVLPTVRACRKSQREDDGLKVLNRMVTSEERRVEALKKIADRVKVPIGQRNRERLDQVISANKMKYKSRGGNFADLVKSHKVINGASPMVGDVYAYVVDTQERFDKWLPIAKKYGMTLIIDPQAEDVVLKPEDASNAYFLPDGTVFINFLEVEMNGSFSPTSQASVDLGTFEADDDALSQDVHDEFGILKLGGAETRITDYGYENLEVLDAGVKRLSNEQLFGGAIQAWYDEHPDTFEQVAIILPGQSDDFTKSDLAEILNCAREGRPYKNAPVSWSVGDSNEEYFMNDLAIWTGSDFMSTLGEDCVIHDASANTCITWAVAKMPDGEWVIAPVRIGDVTGESAAMPAHVQLGQVGYDQFDGIKMEYFYRYDYSKEGPIGVKSCQGGMGSNKEWSGDKGIRDRNGDPWETDPVLTDGSHIYKYDADASTRSRLYMFERKEAMNTLMLKARTNRWGYNLGEVRGIFNGNAELQQGLADGALTYGDWQRALEQSGGFIDFWPSSDPKAQQMNVMLNRMLQRSLNCGLNPTVVFASHVNGKPIRSRWFNCYYVLEPSESFQDSFLHMMATMNPSLCSDGLWDESDDVVLKFYPEALGICRALVPLYYEESDGTLGTVFKRTHISISFSYFTDDTSSLHRRAAESSLFSPSCTNTLMYDGRYPIGKELHEFEWWALSNMQIAQAPNVTVFNTSGGKPVDDVALSAQCPVSDEIAPTDATADELKRRAAQVANPQN